jgi:hypothetical protein
MSPNVQLSHIYPILIPFIHTSTKQRASTNYSGLSPLVPSSRGPSACMHRATPRTNGSLPPQHLVTLFSFYYWTPRYGGIRGLLRFFGGEITGRVFRDWADWLTLLAIVARAWAFGVGGGAWICVSSGTLVRWANWTQRGEVLWTRVQMMWMFVLLVLVRCGLQLQMLPTFVLLIHGLYGHVSMFLVVDKLPIESFRILSLHRACYPIVSCARPNELQHLTCISALYGRFRR